MGFFVYDASAGILDSDLGFLDLQFQWCCTSVFKIGQILTILFD
jgi:hypothetical protein